MPSRSAKDYALWFLIVLLTAASVMSGVMKVVPFEQMAANMNELGYGVAFTRFLGVCWLSGAVGLWFKKYRQLACLGMAAICFGAIAAHISGGHEVQQVTGASVYLLLALLILTLEGFWKKILT